jgi:hypothetical protein
MSQTCPSCSRVLYDRRRATCGYCGASISEELRLSQDEIAKYQEEKDLLEAQHKAFHAKEEAEREEDQARTAAVQPQINLTGFGS